MEFADKLTWRKIAIVILSISAFSFCLTQVAYIELTGVRYGGVDEVVANSAMSLFLLGCRIFPFVLGVGVVLGLPILLVPIIAYRFVERKTGRSFSMTRWLLVFCALITAVLWVSGLLAVVSWFANPLLLVVWLLFLFGSRSATFAVALLTIILMVSYLNVAPLPIGWKDAPIHIQSYAVGYWAWILSAAIMVAASFPYQGAVQLYRNAFLRS